jgi:hypothetical protein
MLHGLAKIKYSTFRPANYDLHDSGILKWKPDNLLMDLLIITGSIEPDLDGLNALFS